VRQKTQDKFWTASQPAFHTYDYGANIEIGVTQQLRSVPKGTRLRTAEEDSDYGHESMDPQASGLVHNERLDGEVADYHRLFAGGLHQLRTELE
jgi:hypothetical protein